MEAALSRFEKENHPTILQTSAELLIKILGNIVKEPANEKFRSINTSNKTISDKVLCAKAARQTLLVVGFEGPAEGETKMIMPAAAAAKPALKAVLGRLEGLLAAKAERERAAREVAIAKNKVQAAQMRVRQEENKIKKQELGATMKAQQAQDRVERESKPDLAAKDATKDLQNMYASGGISAGAKVSGDITIALFTPDGQDRIQVPKTATFATLKKKIAKELGIPEDKQVLGMDRGCKEVVTSFSAKLSAKKVTNGSFLGLKYPGFARPEKKGFQASGPLAEKHVKVRAGKNSLRDEMGKSGKMGITLQARTLTPASSRTSLISEWGVECTGAG